jgi:hypothetical protein
MLFVVLPSSLKSRSLFRGSVNNLFPIHQLCPSFFRFTHSLKSPTGFCFVAYSPPIKQTTDALPDCFNNSTMRFLVRVIVKRLLELVWVFCYNFFRVSMHYNLMGITNVAEICEEPMRLPGMRYLHMNWPQEKCCDVLGRQGQSGEGRWHHCLWPFRCATHQLCLSSHLCLASSALNCYWCQTNEAFIPQVFSRPGAFVLFLSPCIEPSLIVFHHPGEFGARLK